MEFSPSPAGSTARITENTGFYASLQLGPADGGYGEYRLSGGSLGVNAIYVGSTFDPYQAYCGTGVFTQTGGAVGTASAPIGLSIGGNWGNVIKLTSAQSNPNSVGSYTLQNGSLFGGVETIGATGTGTFTQSGGTNSFAGGGDFTGYVSNLDPYDSKDACLALGVWGGKLKNGTHLGNGVGTYNLSGGLLTAGGNENRVELLGEGGTAIFTQSGGTNNGPFLYVGGTQTGGLQFGLGSVTGLDTGASATYTLSGGLLTSSVIEAIGTPVRESLPSRAGTNITPSIYLGGQAHKWPQPTGNLQTKFYTPGTYNLNGGLLQTPFITEDGHLPAAEPRLPASTSVAVRFRPTRPRVATWPFP